MRNRYFILLHIKKILGGGRRKTGLFQMSRFLFQFSSIPADRAVSRMEGINRSSI